jgi:tetratricopeptide (TPR) repeat protein
MYYGMESCNCFIHCSCFGQCIGKYDVCLPPDTPNHPKRSIDLAWHEFLKGVITAKKSGPFFVFSRSELEDAVRLGHDSSIHSISDYIEIIEEFRKLISDSRLESIKFHTGFYKYPNEKKKLEDKLISIENEYRLANQILDEIPAKIIPLYQEAVKNCSHHCLFSIYNKGLIHSLQGDWNEAYIEVQNFIEQAELKNMQRLNSKVYQAFGESCLEVQLFHEAIQALTKAIEKDPNNKQAHFYRAAAYFETGNFDQAIQDYLMSDKEETILIPNEASTDFKSALIDSVCRGSVDAAIDFVPSLCNSVYGIGEALWTVHPINPCSLENMANFADASYAMGECVVDYCKNVDWNTVDGYVEQVKTLYENYNQLSDSQKGELIGYAIGKNGVDIFAGGAVLKGVSAYRNLKNVNRLCNLEAMTISSVNKEAIVASSLKHAAHREAYFKNVKYNFDSHNKHIVGHHYYDGTKSIWEHPDPERLLKNFSGKGRPIKGVSGEAGYKETVNFGEHIGIWKDEGGLFNLPTTRGTIHYGKKGAHIVPAHPNPKI